MAVIDDFKSLKKNFKSLAQDTFGAIDEYEYISDAGKYYYIQLSF